MTVSSDKKASLSGGSSWTFDFSEYDGSSEYDASASASISWRLT